jgi:hypothetical protein
MLEGMLEAVKPEGYVVSVEDRVVFIPRESVLQLELYNPEDLDRRLRNRYLTGARFASKGFRRRAFALLQL